MSTTRADRARGALLGLAVGDALGTTLEFSVRDSLPRQTEITGGGPFRLAPGVWTDDTSMALALADSLVAHRGLVAADLMNRFQNWRLHGEYSPAGRCFDIGNATAAALDRYEQTGDPVAGSTSEREAGNGSLMRLAPVAILAQADADRCDELAAAQSRTTHGAPQAVDACVFFAGLLRRAIGGEPKPSLLEPRPFGGHATVRTIAEGGWRGRGRDGIRSSGYVVHTLEAAIWSVDQTASFEEAVVLAVNLGDDADTVGAVTGQLAGSIYGLSAIPARWLDRLAWRERLLTAANDLLAVDATTVD